MSQHGGARPSASDRASMPGSSIRTGSRWWTPGPFTAPICTSACPCSTPAPPCAISWCGLAIAWSPTSADLLTLVEDTSPGIHDTLIAACDRYRYTLLGCTEYHDNCTDNLAAALAALGLQAPVTPSPWNLFMHIPVQPDGRLSFEPPL